MTDSMDQPERDGMELVFPFVACTSNGGPYDDDAFTAGYQAGRIDMALAAASAVGATSARYTVLTTLVGQLELIGMHHGFPIVTAVECDETPEWSVVTFDTGGEVKP
ncbi:hypothetical protein ABT336_13170 [Micromonospora sp. NPDC000207]|uniref:hypothetical protein n=1 Tax=Micromonospora sp. NPDC000207 TaxID=3154246 RepID=UPI0033221EF8